MSTIASFKELSIEDLDRQEWFDAEQSLVNRYCYRCLLDNYVNVVNEDPLYLNEVEVQRWVKHKFGLTISIDTILRCIQRYHFSKGLLIIKKRI